VSLTEPASSLPLYLGFLALIAAERLLELVFARRNAAWSFARGGVEHGRGHYPVMVLLHTALLLGAPVEVWLLDRHTSPLLAGSMLLIAVLAQALRWWCITSLGPRWNTRVIIVPGLAPVTTGPYRWFTHPNYIAVVVEGLALPLLHGAWLTALAFSTLNALLLRARIRCEDEALATLPAPPRAAPTPTQARP
jgi:methyltransferase